MEMVGQCLTRCWHVNGRAMPDSIVDMGRAMPDSIAGCARPRVYILNLQLAQPSTSYHQPLVASLQVPMAPKSATDSLPKAALEYKQMLEQVGGVDAATVKTCCPKQRNKAIGAMKSMLGPDSMQEYKDLIVFYFSFQFFLLCFFVFSFFFFYKDLKTDRERHEFMAEYLLDPQNVSCKGATFVSRTSTTTSTTTWVWLTEAELAGPSWFNSEENWPKLAQTGPHWPKLAQTGWPKLAQTGPN